MDTAQKPLHPTALWKKRDLLKGGILPKLKENQYTENQLEFTTGSWLGCRDVRSWGVLLPCCRAAVLTRGSHGCHSGPGFALVLDYAVIEISWLTEM